jgi:hypothetical protein
MHDRIFGDREKAMEESYFRKEDARLLEQLRKKAPLDDIALALGEKLQVDNPRLLQRVRDAGISLDNAAALLLAPLVQVAWAEESVTRPEHDAVLRLARERGVATDSPAYAQLESWLRERPSDEIFDIAIAVIKHGFSVLPVGERNERIKVILDACNEVAEASGSSLGFVLALSNVMGINRVSESETATLEMIGKTLRKPDAEPRPD